MRQKLNIKRTRSPGSIEDAMLIQWRALEAAESVMYHAAKIGNYPTVLSAAHAITQASTAYAKLIEIADLAARVAALEEAERQRSTRMQEAV